ncbi:sphingomyelin phosphodiesterase [Phellopilus nigrolimitatus]|nr:sphingomyelin phosphodiesterase [Phellopilus nigrolimitatus]
MFQPSFVASSRLSRHAARLALLVLGLVLLPQLALGSQTVFELDASTPITDDILNAARNARTTKSCTSCQALLLPLKRLAAIGDDRFVSAMTRICKVRKLQDPDICEGDVGSQGPIIANALRRISVSGRTARLFCNALFGMCDPEPIERYDVAFPSPAPETELGEGRLQSRGRTPFQVVHLSDVHIDREYTVGSEANCTKYICCRNFSPDEEEHDIAVPAEAFGHRRCDSPIELANSMLKAVNTLVPDARFTISSGDVVDHANWLLSQSTVESRLHGFHEQLFANTSETNTFYGSIGNHDTYPTNDFPRSTSEVVDGAQWVFDLLGSDWERWIGKSGASSALHKSGSYAVVHPGTKLKLISINTQYWYKFNFWVYDSDEFQPDPNDILTFLVSELDAAERAGQRAWIFGHIPPGASDVMRDQSNYYNQIVQRYRHTIAGQFFGHTHHDQFQIAYTNYSDQTAENAMSFGLIAPSLTPTNGNPAFTVYDVDPDTYDIMDAKVYIANMSEPSYQVEPKWEFYYSARASYGPLVASVTPGPYANQSGLSPSTPLDAAFWHRLTEVFAANDTTFKYYIDHMTRSAPIPHGRRECGEKCRNTTICDIRAMRAENSCYKQGKSEIIVPGPGDRISSEPGSEFESELDAHNACEGSALPTIMRRLVAWAQVEDEGNGDREVLDNDD